jgi:tetratricopeptide (TPR) repeat protein
MWLLVVALPLLAVILLLMAYLAWGVVAGPVDLPQFESPAWLQDTALAAVIATPTPGPTPTPTLMPSQLAAQFVPQLREAIAARNWDRALEIVGIMQALDPSGEEVQQWALTTRMQYGQALVEGGQETQAQAQFDRAVALAPNDVEAGLWQGTTELYLAGREALATNEWDAAIESFTAAYGQVPDYSDLFARLVESYRYKGQAAIEGENWPVAIESLIEAHKRVPEDADILDLLSRAYRGQGKAAMADEDWSWAIETLTEAGGWLPDDQRVVDLLASAYLQRGIARQEALKLKEAKADLETTLELRPGDPEAKSHLGRVEYLLSKRIEIDISKQRLYAWKGDQLVYKFVVSTGIRGRDTATGRYQVLDKIPMAYSRIWRLKMPYWLGIYYVQGIENGIHALPIRPNGSVMWGGLLGQRASYGCIILSNQAAKKLYNWADIGTRVHIHR